MSASKIFCISGESGFLAPSTYGMRALVSMPDPPYAQLAEVADPQPEPSEALVEVRAFSLNRGECKRLASMEPGSVTGWDVAGVVRAAAADVPAHAGTRATAASSRPAAADRPVRRARLVPVFVPMYRSPVGDGVDVRGACQTGVHRGCGLCEPSRVRSQQKPAMART